MLTIVEESGLRVARRGPRRGGGGRGAPAAPLANHVDLLVRLVPRLGRRSRLPLLGHEAARHGGACIGLNATASAKNRRTEKREKRESGAPGERRCCDRASSCVVRVPSATAVYMGQGECARRHFDRCGRRVDAMPHKLCCQLERYLRYSQSTSGNSADLRRHATRRRRGPHSARTYALLTICS